MSQQLRWGIASCGLISSDFVTVLQTFGSTDHVVVACAARALDSAKKFADTFQIPKYFDKYSALGEDPEVDIVYVASLNPHHHSMAKMFLSAGKAVLCEKPLCMNLKEAQELVSLSKEKNVFLMEGMWSRCNPIYRELGRRLQAKEIGEVTHVHVPFGVPMQQVDRINDKSMGGGVTPDIGNYAVSFILKAMGDDAPIATKAFGKVNDSGAETEVTAMMEFSGSRFATFTLSGSVQLPNDATIFGSKGTITLECPFWSPEKMTSPSGEVCNPLENTSLKFNFPNAEFLKFEAEEVAKCMKEGRIESPVVPHSVSLKVAKIIEEVQLQIGVKC